MCEITDKKTAYSKNHQKYKTRTLFEAIPKFLIHSVVVRNTCDYLVVCCLARYLCALL